MLAREVVERGEGRYVEMAGRFIDPAVWDPFDGAEVMPAPEEVVLDALTGARTPLSVMRLSTGLAQRVVTDGRLSSTVEVDLQTRCAMGVDRLPFGSCRARLMVDRQTYTATFPTEAKAREWLVVTRGRVVGARAARKSTVEEYARRWLGEFVDTAAGVDPYQRDVAEHVVPVLGSRPLVEVRPAEIAAVGGVEPLEPFPEAEQFGAGVFEVGESTFAGLGPST